jgi:hypothetical protein
VRLPSFAPARRASFARAALLAALLVGYVDLARGGTVVAPLVLVAAYLVLVPLALLVD